MPNPTLMWTAKEKTVQGRYRDAWADAAGAQAALWERRRLERGYRERLALTDELLGRLERKNLAGEHDLDDDLRREIALALVELPARARSRFPAADTVQTALDGMFAVQEELLLPLRRMLSRDRLVSSTWEGRVHGGDERQVAHRAV